MSYKNSEPDDPMELVGVVLPAAAETQREMAYVFAEEFARMGYQRDRLLRVFKNPFYAGAHGAYRDLGETEILAIIDECLDAWGRATVIVQDVQSPSFILPRDAGEERGGGSNALNGLNLTREEIDNA